jgi:hypothetical protein
MTTSRINTASCVSVFLLYLLSIHSLDNGLIVWLPRQVRSLFLKSDKLYIEKCVFFRSNDDDSTRWKCLVIPVKFQLILDLKSPLIRHQLMRNWGYSYLGNIWRLQRPVHFPLGHSYGVLLLLLRIHLAPPPPPPPSSISRHLAIAQCARYSTALLLSVSG